jgi:thioesterase domain-containing protein
VPCLLRFLPDRDPPASGQRRETNWRKNWPGCGASSRGWNRWGVGDSFFERGGDSLLATRLLTHIEERYGLLPTVPELLQRPTIKQLAEFLTGRLETIAAGRGARDPKTSRPCLFCLTHGFTLSKYPGPDQPVYFFPLDESVLRRHDRIEGLAAALAERVRAVQPDGPVCLAGYCAEGIVAIELARVLKTAGREVAFLGLMECAPFDLPHRINRWRDFPWTSRLRTHLAALAGMDTRHRVGYLAGRARTVLRLIRWRLFPETAPVPPNRLGESLLRSIRSYRPSSFPDRVAVFIAAEQPHPSLEASAWTRQNITHLDTVTVAGDHFTMWDERHVAVLGEQFRIRFEEALRARG